jgi:CheY-like chemotaxis protein
MSQDGISPWPRLNISIRPKLDRRSDGTTAAAVPWARSADDAGTKRGRFSMALLPPLVLLVENDPAIRDFAGEVLREAGYVVLAAADAGEALTRLERDAAAIDILFTDVAPPGRISGYELARRARAVNPRIEIVFTRDFAAAAGDSEPAEAVDRLLRKPYSSQELAREMTRAAGGRRR